MRTSAWVVLVGCLLAGGCSAPVVTITHDLPAALPVVEPSRPVTVGEFAVVGDGGEELAGYVAEALQQRLMELGIGQMHPGDARGGVTVGGTLAATVTDTTVQRPVRALDAGSGGLADQSVDSLVRQIELTCEFVADRGMAGSPVTAEVKQSYDSRNDPRVRGELGLGRSDDPSAVPPADVVLKELAADAVNTYAEMIRPLSITAEAPMRPVSGAEEGLTAAAEGRFEDAYAAFKADLPRRSSELAFVFDFAVAAEAAGHFEEAEDAYRTVVEKTDRQDLEAVEGHRRVKLVAARLAHGP